MKQETLLIRALAFLEQRGMLNTELAEQYGIEETMENLLQNA